HGRRHGRRSEDRRRRHRSAAVRQLDGAVGADAGCHVATATLAPVDRALIDDCVHCGFCLPTCPTYVLWQEEMDSPRGRIWLMRATLDGTVELNRTVA